MTKAIKKKISKKTNINKLISKKNMTNKKMHEHMEEET